MGPEDHPVKTSRQSPAREEVSAELSSSRLPIVCLTLALIVQPGLIVVAWQVPELRLHVVLVSVLACLLGLLFVYRLATGHRRIRQVLSRPDATVDSERPSSITQLVERLQPVLQGDLRVRAPENPHDDTEALGAILNHLLAELRWLVGQCQAFSDRIDSLVDDPREQLRRLHDGFRHQSSDIHEAVNSLAAMTSRMASLSAMTRDACSQARDASTEAAQASRRISENQRRLAGVQEQSATAMRTLRRLSRSATSVDTQLGAIFEVARRADLLALNSTLQVTTGVSGNAELSHLSEEVTDLARVIHSASNEIAFEVSAMHQDTVDAMAAMKQLARELAHHLDQLDRTGVVLSSVADTSKQLHGLVDDMTSRTLSQTTIVRKACSTLETINDVSSSGQSRTLSWAHSLDELQSLALELRSSVADFRLPSIPASIASAARREDGQEMATRSLSDV